MNTEIKEALRKLEQSKALFEGALAGNIIEPINNPDGDWEPIEVLLRPEEYRLKSAPRRIWVNYGGAGPHVFDSEAEAKAHPAPSLTDIAVPFIEVMS